MGSGGNCSTATPPSTAGTMSATSAVICPRETGESTSGFQRIPSSFCKRHRERGPGTLLWPTGFPCNRGNCDAESECRCLQYSSRTSVVHGGDLVVSV